VADPSAPGNVWRLAHQWPLPHDDLSLYMTADRRLERERPAGDGAALAYDYDPHNPVPTLREGPDDKPSLYERPDILRFESAPLAEPLEVTGRVQIELYVSTDVPDTTFMGQLLDIYPDGRVVKLLDRAVMARYRDGLDDPKPMAPGEVARVVVDLWSTAIVFAPGHRIGACVTSSNAWKYEVHPNSFEPVSSYDAAPVAHVVVHLSGRHASRLILPVVHAGASAGLVR
jgi:putative CocE/NonD family hydrolase